MVLLQPRLLHLVRQIHSPTQLLSKLTQLSKGKQHRSLPQSPPIRLLLRRLEHRHVQKHDRLVRRLFKLLLLGVQ